MTVLKIGGYMAFGMGIVISTTSLQKGDRTGDTLGGMLLMAGAFLLGGM